MVKSIKPKQAVVTTAAFILGASIIIGGGYYRKSLTLESPSINANFENKNQTYKEFVFDIQNEGFPKRLIQPGRISISTGHGGVLNKTGKPILVSVKTEGLPGNPVLVSSDETFDVKNGKLIKPLKPGKLLNVGVNLDIPRSAINKSHDIGKGKIIFEDSENGTVIGTLPVKIINSAL
ncbi:MAG TPA: hypothetical protein VF941_02360 [Clostridia bacterium]